MSSSLRNLFFIAMLVMASAVAYAVVVKGVVKDSDGEPVTGASIRLLKARDSAYVAGTVTDMDGNYNFPDVAAGRYLV